MRMLWLVGCVVSVSTANAQPAGSADGSPAVPPGVAPPSAAPGALGGPPGLTPPCTWQPAAGPGCGMPQSAPSMLPGTPMLVMQSEPDLDYRWQVIAADGVSLAFAFSGNMNATSLGIAGYVVGAPLIHVVHGEGGRGGTSLVLRVALPLVGVYAGQALARRSCSGDDLDCDDGSFGGAILGLGLGVLTAMVVDAALIARPVKRKPTMTWVPQLTAAHDRVGLGVAGRF